MLAYVEYASNRARATGDWIVLVVPDRKVLAEVLPLVSGMAPEAVAFSGRTMTFPGGGKFSATEAGVEVFPSEVFDVLFAGWTSAVVMEDMQRWRTEARRVLRLT